MIHYTVLIPQRDSTDAVRDLVPRLCAVLKSLVCPFEIICIDDASPASDEAAWDELLAEFAPLRVLRFDSERGTSAALTAGIAAARGDLILAIGAHSRLSVDKIPQLISRLSQHDLVLGRLERPLGGQIRAAVSKVSRVLTAAPQLAAAEDLFWAARRDAVCGLALARGTFRLLGELVARRGLRVCELTFSEWWPPRGCEFRPCFIRRVALGWLDRRFEPHLACELVPSGTAPHWKMARVEVPLRHVPQVELVPLKENHADST